MMFVQGQYQIAELENVYGNLFAALDKISVEVLHSIDIDRLPAFLQVPVFNSVVYKRQSNSQSALENNCGVFAYHENGKVIIPDDELAQRMAKKYARTFKDTEAIVAAIYSDYLQRRHVG